MQMPNNSRFGSIAFLLSGAAVCCLLAAPAFLVSGHETIETSFFALPDGWAYTLFFLPLALAVVVYKALDLAGRKKR